MKNIIFDLGMVLLNVDFLAPARELKEKYGIDFFQELYSREKQVKLFDDFEEGKISNEKFRDEIRVLLKINLSDEEIDRIWNLMLLDYPADVINVVKGLKNKYRIFLLSNTNGIHFQFYNKRLEDEYGFDLYGLFEKVYLSYEIGLKKPNPEIFEYVLKDSGLKIEETLFVDDTEKHIKSAEKLGLKTCHIKDNMSSFYDCIMEKL